jgi:hypothetical protein
MGDKLHPTTQERTMRDEKNKKNEEDGNLIRSGPDGHPLLEHPEGNEIPVNGPGARSGNVKTDSGDSLYQFSEEGVPISKDPYADSQPRVPNDEESREGFTGGAHQKKRVGTEDAQKRSDTGTGL